MTEENKDPGLAQLNVLIPVELHEHLKDAQHAEKHRWELHQMVEASLILYLAKLEIERGGTYPWRPDNPGEERRARREAAREAAKAARKRSTI